MSHRKPKVPKLQQGFAASTEPKNDTPPDWVRDAKTGLFLPETARGAKHPMGFADPSARPS